MKKLIVTAAFLALPGFLLTASAQDRESRMNDTIEMVRTIVQAERQAIVKNSMILTAAESEAFWPLYREYRNDMSKVLDRRAKVIRDYAAEYGNLSDETAKYLLDESLKIENDLHKVKKKYVKKFRKILPPVKVTRFYQVEAKLDAVVAVELAQEIPLVE